MAQSQLAHAFVQRGGLVFAAHTPLDPRSLADQEAGATAVKRSSRADRSFRRVASVFAKREY